MESILTLLICNYAVGFSSILLFMKNNPSVSHEMIEHSERQNAEMTPWKLHALMVGLGIVFAGFILWLVARNNQISRRVEEVDAAYRIARQTHSLDAGTDFTRYFRLWQERKERMLKEGFSEKSKRVELAVLQNCLETCDKKGRTNKEE